MLTRSGRNALLTGAFLLIVAMLTDWIELGYLGLFLLLAVLAAVPLAWTRPRLEVGRVVDPVRVTVGRPSLGVLTVKNTSARPIGATTAEESIGESFKPIALPNLAPTAQKVARYRLPTDRRAVLTIGPLRMVRQDPFGFVRFEQRRGSEETLWVHPKRYPLASMPTSFIRSLDGPTTDSAPQGTVSFHAIRDYVHGDDRRLIHWRTTARAGKLMVKQNVDTTQPDLTLVIDTRENRIGEEDFEVAMEISASLAVACSDQRYPVRIRTTAGLTIQPVRNEAPAQFFLDRLAGLDRSTSGSLDAVVTELTMGSGGVNLVVVTSRPEPSDFERIVSLKRRYRSMAVIDVDQRHQTPTTTPRSGILTFQVATGADFAMSWNRAVG